MHIGPGQVEKMHSAMVESYCAQLVAHLRASVPSLVCALEDDEVHARLLGFVLSPILRFAGEHADALTLMLPRIARSWWFWDERGTSLLARIAASEDFASFVGLVNEVHERTGS